MNNFALKYGLLTIILFAFKVVFSQNDGSLDFTFGSGGEFSYSTTGYCAGVNILQQQNGQLIQAQALNENTQGSYSKISLIKLTEYGIVDPYYGYSGETVIDMYSNLDGWLNLLEQDSNDNVFVLGLANDFNTDPSITSTMVTKLKADGTFDITFGQNGTVIHDVSQIGSFDEYFYDLKILASGKILLTGYVITPLNSDPKSAILRLNANGTRDVTFGNNGVLILNPPLPTGASSLAFNFLQNDGSYIVLGVYFSENPSYNGYFFLRLLNDGNIDINYGSNGFMFLDVIPGIDSYISAIQFDPTTGDFTIGGELNNVIESTSQAWIRKIDANGNIDFSYGNNGISFIQINTELAGVSDLVITDNNEVIATVYTSSPNGYFLVRLDSLGNQDFTFDSQSSSFQDSESYITMGNTILDNEGRILFCGSVENSTETTLFTKRLKCSQCSVVNVIENDDGHHFDVYPNPAQDEIQVVLHGWQSEESTLEIVNIAGEVVGRQNFVPNQSTPETIQLVNLPAGMYMMRCIGAGQVQAVTKFQVVR